MKLYMAPMEQITGYVFRNAMQDVFGGADKFFSPFITAAVKRAMRTRELKDVNPANNPNICLVPQIMTKDAESFELLLCALTDMGYREFNLNAGCPSGTVVAKGKGAGLLEDPSELDRLLHGLFEVMRKLEDERSVKLSLSVKTRIGMEEAWEWDDILAVYDRYPLSELIIHPRYSKQYYNGSVDISAFEKAYRLKKDGLIYNGDIFTIKDYSDLNERFKGLSGIMAGRGILMDPGFFRRIRTGRKTDKAELKIFYNRLFEAYSEDMGPGNAIMRLKELWHYTAMSFDPDTSAKALKAIKKSRSPEEYSSAVNRLFDVSKLIL